MGSAPKVHVGGSFDLAGLGGCHDLTPIGVPGDGTEALVVGPVPLSECSEVVCILVEDVVLDGDYVAGCGVEGLSCTVAFKGLSKVDMSDASETVGSDALESCDFGCYSTACGCDMCVGEGVAGDTEPATACFSDVFVPAGRGGVDRGTRGRDLSTEVDSNSS